jgi:hypothetical protein
MIFESAEDADYPPDTRVCERAPFMQPFAPNVLLGASLRSIQTRGSDGMVIDDGSRQIGTATACAWITTLAPGSTAPFYVELIVDGKNYPAGGTCTVMSNTIPVSALYLVGCSLSIRPNPEEGLLGGVVTSNSVFNRFSIPGFETGSVWTMHLYTEER